MNSKDYFDRVAQDWDEMRENFFSDEVREEALSTAALQKGKIAADIGAGTGFISEGLIQARIQVIAVDQSEAILKEMKRKFADIETIDYRVGQAQNLPISDGTIDYVFANMYLHHVESPSKAIEEMVRILKPGGKLVITDLDEHEFGFLREEHHDRWMGFKRADIVDRFQGAGLTNICIDSIGTCCEALSSCGSEFASIGIFIASGGK